jgi:hypothetical protein
MNIRKALTDEHSKQQVKKIATFIDSSPSRMSKLMEFYFCDDTLLSQRAAWVLSTVAHEHPELTFPYLKKIVSHLNKAGLHDAVKRNGVKVLEIIDIPKNLYGVATDLCFRLLSNPSEAIAIRCYAMTVLAKICNHEPDLKNELKLVMEASLPFASAGFRSRVKKTLKEIEVKK